MMVEGQTFCLHVWHSHFHSRRDLWDGDIPTSPHFQAGAPHTLIDLLQSKSSRYTSERNDSPDLIYYVTWVPSLQQLSILIFQLQRCPIPYEFYKTFHAEYTKKKGKYFWKMRHENKPILLLRYKETEGKTELCLTFPVQVLSIHTVHNLQVVAPSGQTYWYGLWNSQWIRILLLNSLFAMVQN